MNCQLRRSCRVRCSAWLGGTARIFDGCLKLSVIHLGIIINSTLLQQLGNQLFGSDLRTLPSHLPSIFLACGMVTVPEIKIVGFVAALAVGAALVVFLRYTRLGRAIRATAQNARAARVLGIDTDRVYAATFALNCAICGAAGVQMAHHEESQISIQLLTAIPHGTYVECFADPERDPLWQTVWQNRPAVKNGLFTLPAGNGFGIELDRKLVEKYRIA